MMNDIFKNIGWNLNHLLTWNESELTLSICAIVKGLTDVHLTDVTRVQLVLREKVFSWDSWKTEKHEI
jgi:hypothetical protein